MNKVKLLQEGAGSSALGRVMTVTGAIDPQAMGFTLPHEHVMSTFGAESARYPYYDVDALFGKKHCSVRQRPMPSAPKLRATSPSSGR